MTIKRLPIAKQLERDAVHLIAKEPRFYQRVGSELDPELLSNPHARLVVQAARAFYRETGGQVPMGLSAIAQRLRRLREQGRITYEEQNEAFDWIEAVWSETLPPREAIIIELSKELRRHLEKMAIEKGMDLFGKNTPLSEVKEMLAKAERLGQQAHEAHSTTWDDDDDDRAPPLEIIERLPTGIGELDRFMKGGLARGEFGFAMGAPGAGKSQFLSQVSAAALQVGHNPFIVTLEISERVWLSRLKAAASDIPANLILEGELTDKDRAQIRKSRGAQLAKIVPLPPKLTLAEEIWRLFDEANRELEAKALSPHRYDVLIIDYADKLGWPKDIKGAYEGQDHVYETLLHGTRERNIWCWTASQAKRKESKRGNNKDSLLRMDDVADSIHKVRNADVILTLNPSADRSLIRVLLEKNRTGENGFLSDMMPTDYAFGRLVQPEYPTQASTPENANLLPFNWN